MNSFEIREMMIGLIGLHERQKTEPVGSVGGGEKIRPGSFKMSSRLLQMMKKGTEIDRPDKMLFGVQRDLVNKIDMNDLPKIWNEKDMAGAQDVIANSPKVAFRLWLKNVEKHSPRIKNAIRETPENIPLYFYATVLRVSGREIADEVMKKYFMTDMGKDLPESVDAGEKAIAKKMKAKGYEYILIFPDDKQGKPLYTKTVKQASDLMWDDYKNVSGITVQKIDDFLSGKTNYLVPKGGKLVGVSIPEYRENNRTVLTEESAGRWIMSMLVPIKDVISIEKTSDKQTGKLATDVWRELEKRITNGLGEDGDYALKKLMDKRNFQPDSSGMVRNNIFKAADLLKINLPSSHF